MENMEIIRARRGRETRAGGETSGGKGKHAIPSIKKIKYHFCQINRSSHKYNPYKK